MAEDTIIETSESEKRIKQLSDKVKTTSEERDEKDRLLKEQSDKTTASEKKAAFYKDFSKISAEYKDAPEFADEIEAKVMGGYTPRDAAVSVLMEKGKFNPSQTTQERTTVAGGSATTTPPQGGVVKSPEEMTRDEKRAALLEAEKNGELSVS